MPNLPFQNATLGVSPEVLNPYFQQFQASGVPNPQNTMGVCSDCAVIFTLTSAQLLALNTTPVPIVAAPVTTGIPGYLVPPRGYLYVPELMLCEYVYGGTAYTLGGTAPAIQIVYAGQTTGLVSTVATGLLNQTVNTVAYAVAGNQTSLANTVCANLGLNVSLGGTTPTLTLGNGTLTIHLLYNIYALI